MPSWPFFTELGVPVTGIELGAGGSLSFRAENLSNRETVLTFEVPTGAGVLYISLDGPATADHYDYQIAFDNTNRGPFRVVLYPGHGTVDYQLVATEDVAGAEINITQPPPPPPPITNGLPFPSSWAFSSAPASSVSLHQGVIAVGGMQGFNEAENRYENTIALYRWNETGWELTSLPDAAPGRNPVGLYEVGYDDHTLVIDDVDNQRFVLNRRVGDHWQTSYLNHPASLATHAVSGDRVAVGLASEDPEGEVRIAEWDGTRWNHDTLVPKPVGVLVQFGRRVALSGDVLMVGAWLDDRVQRRWLWSFYRRSPTGWGRPMLQETPPGGYPPVSNFPGSDLSLSLDGDRAAAGIRESSPTA